VRNAKKPDGRSPLAPRRPVPACVRTGRSSRRERRAVKRALRRRYHPSRATTSTTRRSRQSVRRRYRTTGVLSSLANEPFPRPGQTFCRLLRLEGVSVREVRFTPGAVVVEVALRRQRLCCPCCEISTRAQGHSAGVLGLASSGIWGSGGLRCSAGGAVWSSPSTGRAPRACRSRARAWSSRATSSAWSLGWPPARTTARSAGWSRSTGTPSGGSFAGVCAEELDPDRLEDLYDLGIDEVSWNANITTSRSSLIISVARSCGAPRAPAQRPPMRSSVSWTPSRHSYATSRRTSNRSARPTLAGEPFPPRAGHPRAISLDMGPGYAKSAREHAPQAVICIDPYHACRALAARSGVATPSRRDSSLGGWIEPRLTLLLRNGSGDPVQPAPPASAPAAQTPASLRRWAWAT